MRPLRTEMMLCGGAFATTTRRQSLIRILRRYEAAEPYAGPNDEERGHIQVSNRASIARSSSSVSFAFGMTNQPDNEELDLLIVSNRKLEAIRLLRERRGLDLAAATDALMSRYRQLRADSPDR